MRNLKRVLSLSLASIMLFGMMVVGASAVEGYYDVDAEDNIEAIDVLQQVQVMVGYPEDGGFHPDDPVTRAEMMVIMAKLLDLDYNYYSTSCPFTDVPDWAKGYVGAAYANKVAYGRGDGIFDPNSTVTPVEASAFLMRALGYFQYSNDYADGFELATVRQGTAIDIYHGVSSSASEPMTRNQVAKMVLNTLESGMVQPDGNTINLTTPDGSVLTGKVNYVYVTSNKDFATAISRTQATAIGSTNTGAIVELGEQLYNGDLKLYDESLDDFGRPSRHWEYDGTSIGTYIKKDLLREEYTAKVTGKELYELLGSEVVRDYEFEITIDGETEAAVLNSTQVSQNSNQGKNQYYYNKTALNRTNTNQVGGTGNGVLTQVFVDGNKKEVYIAVINTYLAKAVADYSSSRNDVLFNIYNVARVTEGTVTALVKDSAKADANLAADRVAIVPERVYGEDFDITGVKADDIVLVHLSGNTIKEMFEPEVIDETEITAFRTDSYVVAGGNQINYAHTAMYNPDVLDRYVNTNMKDTTYRVYLDPYGYLIGLDQIDKANQYVFLTGINSTTENLRDQTAIGNVVFLDGTSKNVSINMKDSTNAEGNAFNYTTKAATYLTGSATNIYGTFTYSIKYDTTVSSLMNTWCSYSVDEDGVYTLKEVPNTPERFSDTTTNRAGHGQSHMGDSYYVNQADYNAAAPTYYHNNAKTIDNVISATPVTNGSWANGYKNDEYVVINKSNVFLDGIPGTTWTRVYGNNDTVYLTAETELLSSARNVLSKNTNGAAIIITGAESVSTGVQDVDLAAWNGHAVVKGLETDEQTVAVNNNLTYLDVSNGVYTLFDEDGYVIAAMIVGDDDDSNVSYAWVSSGSMNREALVDGKWEYSRAVIIDGQAATLTELESNGLASPDIDNKTATDPQDRTEFSYWWEVKTKADGTVKSVTRITDTPTWSGTDSSHRYVYDIHADTSRSGTTILNEAFGMGTFTGNQANYIPLDTNTIDGLLPTSTYKVRVTGNTLQVEGLTGKVRGFAVSENANIVVVKDERVMSVDGLTQYGWNYKGEIEYFTNDRNATGLTQAVNYLNNSSAFRGYIAAVLKDGRAESVIIYDKTWTDINTTNTTVPADNIVVYQWKTGFLNVYYLDKDATNPVILKSYEVEDAIKEYMMKDGLDVTDVTFYADATTDNAQVKYNRNGQVQTGRYTVTLIPIPTDAAWNTGKPWLYP